MNHQDDLRAAVQFYESLTIDSVSRVDDIYTNDAWFKDPFNEVRGIAAISKIFTHMFAQVKDPKFVVTTSMVDGGAAFLTWEFHFRMKRFSPAPQCIRGATHLRFAPSGKIEFHRDYWDAAEELYEKIPALGSLMRTLKRLARG
ncbi:nuclear transport factor 2 family protein [soil metagenome]